MERYRKTEHSLETAVRLIPRGKHILVGSGAAVPRGLISELVRQSHRFSDNHISHILTLGEAPYVEARYENAFRHNAYFIGENVREAVRDGRADYTPVFLSQIPELFRQRRLPVDVALIQVSPPDEFGFVNLGVSVDIVLAAVQAASLVIAEINENMPVVHGAGYLRMDSLDAWVWHPSELPTIERPKPDAVVREISRNVASLVDDGATVQVGIGTLPETILASLSEKHDLGIWTEMVSDGLIDLIDCGAVTGRYKTIEPRRVSASFALGSARTYRVLDRNPHFSFNPVDIINDPLTIGRQHKMVAINGALQVDLTGQVCSDSVGGLFYSGIGGQVDFIRGASMCPGGRPIIALRSTVDGESISRIVAVLDEGAGVVTSRGDVHYVVTEYGIADLHGRSVRDRAMALISVAHPDHRAQLLSDAKHRRYVFFDQIEPRARYPKEREFVHKGRNGVSTLIRPLRETDEPMLSDMFYSLSEETIQRRYLAPLLQMPHSDIVRYLRIDDRYDVAMVVQTQPEDDSEPQIVGVARYHRDPTSQLAEVALLIRDDWQGQGYGNLLFERLIQIAKESGLEGFTAEVLSNNRAMLHVFESAGLFSERSYDGNTVGLRLMFSPPSAGEGSGEQLAGTDGAKGG